MKKYLVLLILILLIILGLYIYYSCDVSPPVEEEGKVETFLPPEGPEAYAGTIRLASWNIRVFSNESRDDSDLRYVCRNLADYDFIALLEVKDEPIIWRTSAMLKTMGRDYDYQISGEVGRKVKERYAFLYDKARIKAIEAGQFFQDPGDEFIREPYYSSFRSGKFDFTVIAIHIIWGDRVSKRRAEIQKLADVYRQIQEMDPSEQDVILVGDFNREPNDEKAYMRLRSIPSMKNLFKPPEKSVIYDSNLYDNIWFQSSYLSEYTGKCGIDRFDETEFANDDEQASLIVSDHRPVWAEFDTSRDDD